MLRLKSNNLPDDCVEMLISSLKENCTLEELDLSNDDVYRDQEHRLTYKSVTALKHLLQSSANLKEISVFPCAENVTSNSWQEYLNEYNVIIQKIYITAIMLSCDRPRQLRKLAFVNNGNILNGKKRNILFEIAIKE
ncbi:hypothetical protein scyTo_0009480 [Scyliorhinus torazame]|uniref:Uncharacterized protein n=1 Tax=Scyliorhinus torazame TaxID=75743 RepID=A0A401NMX7_SCYTO|nr:hypothetical protein [Scyliorhinus torazame]